jgi:flagellar capping protein FliD
VNGDSKITTSGLFRAGNVNAGTFKIGLATFNIDNDTTINGLISQINTSDSANATAHWDSINGTLVLTSRTTGDFAINIENDTSNFASIMGYTTQEGSLLSEAQEKGQNAHFTINGTSFTSTSNTIGSDVSRIAGVTINLKDVTEDEDLILTIEKDNNIVKEAVADIVDAYNDLMTNIDEELATTGNLSNQSTLKMIRNQLRSYMTSAIGTTSSRYKNLGAIGISTSSATAGDISTTSINQLTLDENVFMTALQTDARGVRALLVGNDESPNGVLTFVEDLLEKALTSVNGFFATAEKSYQTQISSINEKIARAERSVSTYKTRLENKFSSMDLLISNIQNQYSSFLAG